MTFGAADRRAAAVGFPPRTGIVGIETGRDCHDRPVSIADGHKAHQHRNGMSLPVLQHNPRLDRSSLMQGTGKGAILAALRRRIIIQAGQQIFVVAPDDFMLAVSDDPFRSLVPNQDFPVAVDHTHPGRQTIDHRAGNFRILKVVHGPAQIPAGLFIGGKETSFRAGMWERGESQGNSFAPSEALISSTLPARANEKTNQNRRGTQPTQRKHR